MYILFFNIFYYLKTKLRNFNSYIIQYACIFDKYVVLLRLQIKLMKAELVKASENTHIIVWSNDMEFGEITFTWNDETHRYVVDSEYLNVETMIQIIQSINLE